MHQTYNLRQFPLKSPQRAPTSLHASAPRPARIKGMKSSLHSTHFNMALRPGNLAEAGASDNGGTTGKGGRRLVKSGSRLAGARSHLPYAQLQRDNGRNSNSQLDLLAGRQAQSQNRLRSGHQYVGGNPDGARGQPTKSSSEAPNPRLNLRDPKPLLHQTYLKSLYVVRGNGFKLVQQPNLKARLQDQGVGHADAWTAQESQTIPVKEDTKHRVGRTASEGPESEIKSMLRRLDQIDSRQNTAQESLRKKSSKQAEAGQEGLDGTLSDDLISAPIGGSYAGRAERADLAGTGNEDQPSRQSTNPFEQDSNMNFSYGGPGGIMPPMAPVLHDQNQSSFVSVQNLIYGKRDDDKQSKPRIFKPGTSNRRQDAKQLQDGQPNNRKTVEGAKDEQEITIPINLKRASAQEERSAKLPSWANEKGGAHIDEEVRILTLNQGKEAGSKQAANQATVEVAGQPNQGQDTITAADARTASDSDYMKGRMGPMLIEETQDSRKMPQLSQTQQKSAARVRKFHGQDNRELKSLLNLKEYTQSQQQLGNFDGKLSDMLNQQRVEDRIQSSKYKSDRLGSSLHSQYAASKQQRPIPRLQNAEKSDISYNVDVLANDHADKYAAGGDQWQLRGKRGREAESEPGFTYGGQPTLDAPNQGFGNSLNSKWANKFFKNRKGSSNVNHQLQNHELSFGPPESGARATSSNSQSSQPKLQVNHTEYTYGRAFNNSGFDKQSLSTQMKTNLTAKKISNQRLGREDSSNIYTADDNSNVLNSSSIHPYNAMHQSSSRGALRTTTAQRGGLAAALNVTSQPKGANIGAVIGDRGNIVSKQRVLKQDSSQGPKRGAVVGAGRGASASTKVSTPYVHHRKLADITQDINSVKKFRKTHQMQMESQLMDQINYFEEVNKQRGRPGTTFEDVDGHNGALRIEQDPENMLPANSGIQPSALRQKASAQDASPYQAMAGSRERSGSFRSGSTSIEASRLAAKKLNMYEKKDRTFQKVYEQTVTDLRERQVRATSSLSEAPSAPRSKVGSVDPTPRQDVDQGSLTKDITKQESAREKKLQGAGPKQRPIGSELCIYQDGNRNHKIISNRIKILSRANQARRFVHKDAFHNERQSHAKCAVNEEGKCYDTFDPIRTKLRIMPTSRAPKVQGKTPDYYFIQASKHSMTNNLTIAIEALHKGLAINDTHLLCRLTHGVLMFKLGLFSQAKFDFEYIADVYPKEKLLKFNHALTLLQLGKHDEASEVLDVLIKLFQKSIGKSMMSEDKDQNSTMDVVQPPVSTSKQMESMDFELLYDTHMLKAQCLWRSNQPLEAVKNFKTAKRYAAQYEQRKVPGASTTELQNQLKDLEYREMKLNIAEDYEVYQSLKSKSPKSKGMKYFFNQQTAQPTDPNDANVESPAFATSQGQHQSKAVRETLQALNVQDLPTNQAHNQRMHRGTRSVRSVPELSTYYENSETLRDKNGTDTFNGQIDNAVKILDDQGEDQHDAMAPMKLGFVNAQKQMSINTNKSKQTLFSDKGKNSLSQRSKSPVKVSDRQNSSVNSGTRGKSDQSQSGQPAMASKMKLESMKNQLIQQRKATQEQVQKMIFDRQAEEFAHELRENQIKIIDSGHSKHSDKIYADVLKPIQEKLADSKLQGQKPKGPRKETRFECQDQIEEVAVQESKEELDNLTAEEPRHIELRKSMKRETAQFDDPPKQTDNGHSVGEVGGNKSGNGVIGARTIEGANFTQNGICEINNDQVDLEEMMVGLEKKFLEVAKIWEKELAKDEKRIFQRQLKDEDATEYQRQTQANQKQKEAMKDDDGSFYKPDKVIEKLRDALQRDTNLPDDVTNILRADLDEKEKLKQIQAQTNSNQPWRIGQRQLQLIAQEFETATGSQRSVEILDVLLGNLKWFQRFDQRQRKLIFEQAEYLRLDARKSIFRQGDFGDKMYVVLKGRVAVEKTAPEYDNLPLVQALLKDGDAFGELSLIDREKLAKQSTAPEFMSEATFEQRLRYEKRNASCITAEDTDLLVIAPELGKQLYQPDKKHSGVQSQGEPSADASSRTSASKDQLSKKIAMLQSIHIFADIDARDLTPLACNIVPKTYSYGEFLAKKGAMPPGLIIITEGQCKVVADRFGSRTLLDNRYGAPSNPQPKSAAKLGIKDRILDHFNPQTSVLNQVNSMKNGFQNTRVLIEEGENGTGKEIKDRIDYQDYMTFSQLTRGDCFGGRVLVPYDHFSKMKRHFFGQDALDRYYPPGLSRAQVDEGGDEQYHMKSLLSVIADTAKVEAWVLDNSVMGQLPAKILTQVSEKIILSKEEDRPYPEQDIQFIIDQFVKWDRFKIDCVESHFQRKALIKFFSGK